MQLYNLKKSSCSVILTFPFYIFVSLYNLKSHWNSGNFDQNLTLVICNRFIAKFPLQYVYILTMQIKKLFLVNRKFSMLLRFIYLFSANAVVHSYDNFHKYIVKEYCYLATLTHCLNIWGIRKVVISWGVPLRDSL